MSEGLTCYEQDEELCSDEMCLRTGCRLRNDRLRTKQQMPARIWAEKTPHGYWWTIEPIVDTTSYTRSDIAERMAEALEGLKALIEGEMCRSSWEDTQDMNRAEEALSAFRSATQDTEARHD